MIAAARTQSGGFSLIEVLLAIMLLALLTAGAFGAIRTATQAVDRGESKIDSTNKVRVAQGFLRQQLAQALAIPFKRDPATGEITSFQGERDRVTWVSAMPGYLGRGGAYVQELSLERGERGVALVFRHAMVNGFDIDEGFPEKPGPVTLIERISDGQFEFRGLDDQARLDDWRDTWDKRGPLPLLMRVRIDFERGAQYVWPDQVIALMVDIGAAGASSEPSFFAPPIQPQPSPGTEKN